MAPTVTDICNMALGRIGVSRFIADLSDTSNEARVCAKFYELTRNRVLADFDWNFAKSFVALQDIGSPPIGWAYRYRYPNNCLKARVVTYTTTSTSSATPANLTVDRIPFEVVEDELNGALAICCNILTPTLIFTKQITNPTLFSYAFINSLAWALASEIGAPLTANKEFVATAANAYLISLQQAIANNANEATPLPSGESDFLVARW